MDGDEAERATRETENSLELRTRDRYRKLIGKIDSTLKRLEAGEDPEKIEEDMGDVLDGFMGGEKGGGEGGGRCRYGWKGDI